MRRQQTPHEAYRKVEFDARVMGADPAELVHVCYEHLIGALGTSIHAVRLDDNALKSRSLTRALTAVTALQLGVSGNDGIADALHHLYETARRVILECALNYDAEKIAALRDDFTEIHRALRTS